MSNKIPRWEHLRPVELVEAFGSVIWNGKNCLITLPRRVVEQFPDLKDRRKVVIYKMDVFLSKKAYEVQAKEVIQGKRPVPIHLYFKGEHDK